MNRYIRMRRFKNGKWDTMFPQTVTQNILRKENGGMLENYLVGYDNHLLDNTRHFNHGTTTNVRHPNLSSHRFFDVTIEGADLIDGFPLLLTLHTKADAEPLLSFNDGEYYPIVNASGNAIPGGQAAGTTVLLVWNAASQTWILLSSSDTNDITKIAIPTFTEYTYVAQEDGEYMFVVPGFNRHHCSVEVNYGQTLLRRNKDFVIPVDRDDTVELRGFTLDAGEELLFRITAYEVVAKSSALTYDLDVDDIDLVATVDGQAAFALPPKIQRANLITLNYMQTILRNGLDYEINNDRSQVVLNDFTLEKDEVIVAHTVTLIEHDASVIPGSWNAPGRYTYDIKTVHGSFESDEDRLNVVPIPNFDKTRDELVLIKENKVLVYDVDYEIDGINQVILQDIHRLNIGDVLYYTIFQGAVQDVPPFVVVPDVGENGQHLILDLSYDALRDGFTAVVKLKHRLMASPTIKCLDGPAESILDSFGSPVAGGYVAGSFLWCVYDAKTHVWYSMSHGHYDVSESYSAFEFTEGDANFIGNDVPSYADSEPGHIGELVIPHGLSVIPTDIEIHPTGHPGFLVNPYETPTSDMVLSDTGDNVRWVQWALWNLKYVQLGITLSDWVTGRYDDRTSAAIRHWQSANNLDVEDRFTVADITAMDTQVKGTQCIIGDTWAYADETNIYVGNSGNATSSFHWIATSSAGNTDYRTTIEEATARLVEMIKTYPGNYYTRFYNFTSTEAGTYVIEIPDFSPHREKLYMVNYGQTVLREGIDYTMTHTGIELTRIRLPIGALIQFVMIQQANG